MAEAKAEAEAQRAGRLAAAEQLNQLAHDHRRLQVQCTREIEVQNSAGQCQAVQDDAAHCEMVPSEHSR